MFENDTSDRFAYHSARPEVTTDSYVQERQIALGEEISNKRKIYLDTRFWILLRDVSLGRIDSLGAKSLLTSLRQGANSGTLICPICETTFFEIFKQQDPKTRRTTLALVDELSSGITLADHWERAGTEISHLLHTITGRTNLHDLDHLVWNKLSFVLGVVHPTGTPFSETDERTVQKAFFDHMWSTSLVTMDHYLGGNRFCSEDYEGLAMRLNSANAKHADECRSFEQIYRNEFMGGIETSIPTAVSVIERWYADAVGVTEQFDSSVAEKTANSLLSMFSQAIKTNDFRRTLRTAHIGALCHASFRWDKKRKLTGNWIHDFHHAAAAVGYCDVFLTEKPLAAVLKQNHLKLNEVFSCQIISSVTEAAGAVSPGR